MNVKKARRGSGGNSGFTLVELMVVISIIAVLAAIVGVNVMSSVDDGNVAAAKAQIKNFDTALVAYKIKFKKFPDSLDALISPPSGDPILTAKSVPLDPWDTPYQYQLESSRKYVIICPGA
ncbi:MAG: type II secretion system protein GspG, partial [Candidatus Hydrogenedentes bacterium]|nr:type II secretion system protein GspG [Candidatus Hydrogenedentota bacterium]